MKQNRRILWRLCLLLAICLGAWAVHFLSFGLKPAVARLIARQALAAGVEVRLDLRRLGWAGMDLADITVGSGTNGIRADGVRVDFVPAELRHGRLRRVVVDGLRLTVENQGQGWVVQGLEGLPREGAGSGGAQTVTADSLLVRNGELTLRDQGRTLRVPFSIAFGPCRFPERIVVERIEFGAPFSLVLCPYDAQTPVAESTDSGQRFRGRFRVRPVSDAMAALKALRDADCRLSCEWSGERQAQGGWAARVRLEGATGTGGVSWAQNTLVVPMGILEVTGAGTNSAGQAHVAWTASNVTARAGDAGVRIPECAVTGQVEIAGGTLARARFVAGVRDMSIWAPQLRVDGIRVALPVEFSPVAGQPLISGLVVSGQVAAASIHAGPLTAGPFSVGLSRDKTGLGFLGTLAGVAENVPLEVAGHLAENGDARVSVGGTNVVLRSKRFGAPADATLEGTVRVGVQANVLQGPVVGSAMVTLTDARLSLPEQNVTVEGVNLKLGFRDIARLEGLPSQGLTFSAVRSGDFNAGPGRILLCVEGAESILVEHAEVAWCGGGVSARAMRVRQGERDFDVVLQCDNLDLSQVLSQLKAGRAEGTGTVNGRLPVRFVNGKFEFENGFLYSTPGVPGVLRVAETSAFMAVADGVAKENVQMQITRESLKAFCYDWARLTFNSEGDLLRLSLLMNGRPEHALPFRHDKELGLVWDPKQKAEFEGIQFEITFNIPVNEILKYGKKISVQKRGAAHDDRR